MGIEIYIWDKYVGALVKTSEGIAFQYDPEFKKLGLDLSPINLPLDGKEVYINETDWKATEGIPGLIYDSLPDRFGTNLLKTYFTEKGLTEKDIDIFAKLQYIGSRGMGALEYRPATEIDQTDDIFSLEEIEKISILGTKGKEALNTNLGDKNALLQILHIGTSVGGARAKGNINVQSENIFPIIKKFLYSDHEIFLRELISNAIDATQKLKTLSSMGKMNWATCR